mgnify:FL=1
MAKVRQKTLEDRQQEIGLERELFKSVKKRIREEGASSKSLKDKVNMQLKLHEIRRQETETLEKQIVLEEERLSKHEMFILSVEQALERQESLAEEDQKHLESLREGNETLDETVKRLKAQAKAQEDLIQKQLRQLKIQKDSIEAIDRIEESTRDIIGATTGISAAWEKTFIGSFGVAARDAGGLTKALAAMQNSMKQTLTFQNMLGSSLMKIQESTMAYAMAQDTALAGFNKTSGAAGKYDEVITKVNVENRHLGITMDDSTAATAALRSEMASFRDMEASVTTGLVKHVALMDKMGVSARDSAKQLNVLTKGLHLSENSAKDMQMQLVGLADSLGMDVNTVMSEFTSSLSELAKYGDDAIKVFADLQGAAQATGLAMGDLLSVAKGFDTFEGAATQAAKLNSILGSNLDAYGLLEASEEDRIRMLMQSIEMGGKNWATMGKFERQAVASAAGISDMSKANAIFGGSLQSYDLAQEKAKELAISQKKQEERAKMAMDVTQSMKMAMESLAISIRPLVEIFKSFAQFVAEHGAAFSTFIGFVTAGVIAYKAYAFWVKLSMLRQVAAMGKDGIATGIKGLFTLAQGAQTTATGTDTLAQGANNIVKQAAIPIQTGLTAATTAGVGPMLAFGVAVLMIGGAIALAAYGLAQLVVSFKGLSGEAMMAAVISIVAVTGAILGLGIVLGVLVFSGALPGAALGMLALGAAIMMIGGGIAIAVNSLTTLGSTIDSISEAMSNMVSIEGVLGLVAISSAISQIASALDEIDEDKTIAFGTSMESLTELSKAFTASATVTAVGAAGLVAAGGARTTAMATPANRFEQTAAAAGGGTTSAAGAATGGQPIEVVLMLNDREFARAVANVIDEEL